MTKAVTLKIASIKIGRELMNMNITENNKYRYTDIAERNIRMNRFYIIATSLLAIVFLFYLWLKSQHCTHCYIRKYHSDRCFLCDKYRDTPSK